MKRKLLYSVLALSTVALFGCSDDDDAKVTSIPTYSFATRFTTGANRFPAGTSSVSNPGQTARQVLIADLNTEIATGLDARIASDPTLLNTPAKALSFLTQYYEGGTDSLTTTAIALKAPPLGTKQTVYADAADPGRAISAGKNLKGKIAGSPGEASTEHKDWDAPGNFLGFVATNKLAGTGTAGSGVSPDDLIQTLLNDIAANTSNQALGNTRPDPIDGTKTLKVFQSNDGLDLKQLVQKFLLGAVTFSQGTDDYLDDATAGKGILANNIAQDKGTKAFTALEHQFDEGFGYFGAARNYNHYTDLEIRGKSGRDAFKSGYNDADGDGKIDLYSEFNFGNSTNAAKRDLGSTTGTDFTKAIFDAFIAGRSIISEAGGALSDAQLSALAIQRDIIVENWEKAIAATVVHYINEILADDMAAFDTAAYSYGNHIKHWGEMKGFSLGLQFNPRSPMHIGSLFADFHDKVGERPVLPNDVGGQTVINAYKDRLLAARDILQLAYNFDPLDVAGW